MQYQNSITVYTYTTPSYVDMSKSSTILSLACGDSTNRASEIKKNYEPLHVYTQVCTCVRITSNYIPDYVKLCNLIGLQQAHKSMMLLMPDPSQFWRVGSDYLTGITSRCVCSCVAVSLAPMHQH